ncbi:MAG: (deoxy)nucleoside triphosphate pyrophosphohydrolase [Thermodesulfobacteriaceae bacterium]|nr:(deoxy)nucleoside triphosphate pyrophosphohydrolase [Thermodesulfobacteriaceae bacterium]MDW8136564.1 (deoxy)nucleoside triphosphate pyrophosphohydrolase [Thermodesulfobacterium sp.]
MKKPVYQVVAGFIEKEGKFLLVQRPFHKRNGGLWEFPGGKVERGETLEEALKRELKEELDIEILETSFLERIVHDYEDFQIELFLLKVQSFKGTLTLKEASNFKWVNFASALRLELCEADKKLIQKLLSYKGMSNFSG